MILLLANSIIIIALGSGVLLYNFFRGEFLKCIECIVLTLILGAGPLHWLYNTEPGATVIKDYEIKYGGIEQVVTIFDINGDVIKEYQGKLRVDNKRKIIIVDDENGKRHQIYYTTGTVAIDEI